MFAALSCSVCFSTFNALTLPVSFTICALKDRAFSITVSTFSSSPITSARTSSPFHFFGTKHSLRGGVLNVPKILDLCLQLLHFIFMASP
nr:hypothetical protein Q903MT_gene4824 [Picea sitchensis]